MKPTQLNGTYYIEEDRVMLRIKSNDQAEYRFWLTRVMMQKILTAIEKISIKNIAHTNPSKTLSQGVVEVIDEMQQKAIETETDLTVPYQPAHKLPLGADPQLIKEVTFITIGSFQVNMQFVLKNQTPIDLELNMATLAKIRLLLNELNKKAQWDLSGEHEIVQDPIVPTHAIH
jgi:hypothetical protein